MSCPFKVERRLTCDLAGMNSRIHRIHISQFFSDVGTYKGIILSVMIHCKNTYDNHTAVF